jgi:predicted transcriptional regulator
MQSVKQAVEEIAEALPDNCTWEDAMRWMYVRAKIAEGLADLDAKRVSAHDDVFGEYGL